MKPLFFLHDLIEEFIYFLAKLFEGRELFKELTLFDDLDDENKEDIALVFYP